MTAAPSTTPDWRSSLLPRLPGLPLLPVGAGDSGKAPVDVQTGLAATGWQRARWEPGAIARTDPAVVTAVGMRCGPDAGGLLVLDLDGQSALEAAAAAGCDLNDAGWVITRPTAPDRCKVVFRVPREQWPATDTRRAGKVVHPTGNGEQVEAFWSKGQVVVAGLHRPSGAFLEWRGGPEQITDLPPAWLAFWQSLEPAPVAPQRPAAPAPAVPHLPGDPAPLLELLPRDLEALARNGCSEGGRNDACFRLAAIALATAEGAAAAGLPVAGTVEDLVLTFASACNPPLGWREAAACLRSAESEPRTPDPGLAERIAYQQRQRARGARQASTPVKAAPRQKARQKDQPLPATFLDLIRSLPDGWVERKDFPPSRSKLSPGDLAGMLPAHLLRFNELALLPEVSTSRDWQPIRDADMDSAYVLLSQKGWIIGVEPIEKAVCHVARLQSFHPVRHYLLSLEQNDAITPFDLDLVAPRFFRASEALHVSMVRKWLIGAVARALEPGCQMDYALVLQSDQQGLGKSTGFEVLASPDWFCSTVPDGDKDFLLNVHSCWIFELAELEHVTGARAEGRMKNLITTKSDMVRVPYGRTPERMKRESVFCGTVNAREFLRDETGDRRYWVVPIEGTQKLDREGLKASRDAIWKAALLAYRAGELPMLSDTHAAESEVQNANYRREDPWLAMLQAWVDGNPLVVHVDKDCAIRPADPNEPFSTAEALYSAGLKRLDQITRADETRIGPLLRQLGFERGQRTREGQKQVRRWVKPPEPTPPNEVGTAETDCSASDLEKRSATEPTCANPPALEVGSANRLQRKRSGE